MRFFLVFLFIIMSKYLICNTETTESEKAENLYKTLYKRARAEQLEAVKSLRKLHQDKQQQMILLMGEKVFAVLLDNRAKIEASSYIPGISEFPTDDKIRDVLSNILENTALFAEIILRFPDIAVPLMKINNNWDILLQWSIAFCNQVKYLLDDSTMKLLHLVSQELDHINKSPNYTNPYRKKNVENVIEEDKPKKKKKIKQIRKGPKLSHWEL